MFASSARDALPDENERAMKRASSKSTEPEMEADLLQGPLGQDSEIAGVGGEYVGSQAVNGAAEVLDLAKRLTELSFVLDHSFIRNMPLVLSGSKRTCWNSLR